jgi:hypothetical protein
MIRRVGLHLIWAQPGGYKTSLVLRLLHELTMRDRPEKLLGHPDLDILVGYDRVLIITTEEDVGELRHVAEAVRRGLGDPDLASEIQHLYATGRRRVTLDDLPGIIQDQGPYDLVILDSLTGLRPKTVDGERVRWDLDNDLANELLLRLRALAAEHRMGFWIIHHSDKQVVNYRGPVDWWASCDVMLGLLSDAGRIKVRCQKVRGGRVPEPFLVAPEWDGDRLDFRYAGVADTEALTGTEQRVLAFLRGRGESAPSIIADQIGAHRETVGKALRRLEEREMVERTRGPKGRQAALWVVVESADPTTKDGND